jgi:hypothetical protein
VTPYVTTRSVVHVTTFSHLPCKQSQQVPRNGDNRRQAVPWLRRLVAGLSSQRPGFAPQSEFYLSWVNRHWDTFSSKFFCFSLSVSFHRGCPCSYIIWGMNNRPSGGRSSETVSPHRQQQLQQPPAGLHPEDSGVYIHITVNG